MEDVEHSTSGIPLPAEGKGKRSSRSSEENGASGPGANKKIPRISSNAKTLCLAEKLAELAAASSPGEDAREPRLNKAKRVAHRTQVQSEHGVFIGQPAQPGSGLLIGQQAQPGGQDAPEQMPNKEPSDALIGQEVQPRYGVLIGQQAQTRSGMVIGQQAQTGSGMLIGQQAQPGNGMLIGQQAQHRSGMLIGQQAQTGSGLVIGQLGQPGSGLLIGQQPQHGSGMIVGQQSQPSEDIHAYHGDHMQNMQECMEQFNAMAGQSAPKPASTLPCIRTPKLIKEGAAKMYEHNVDVLKKVLEVHEELEKDAPNPRVIFDPMTDAKSKLMQRLKIIRIADKHGWSAVSIYEGDSELGENPEDSRKIRAAAREAERQKKKAESLRKGKRTLGQQGPIAVTSWPFRGRGSWYPRANAAYGPRFQGGYACYICGQSTHWIKDCPHAIPKPSGFSQKKEA